MFKVAQLTTFFAALTILATASASPAVDMALAARDQCNTGAVQCCSSLQSTTATNLAQTLAGGGLLGIQISAILGNVQGLVGLTCLPLSIVALGGNQCSTQPVCCTDNYMGGLFQAGCNPINI